MTKEAIADLLDASELRVGINLGNILLVTGKRANGDPDGIAPDMATGIADKLGVKVRLDAYDTPGEVADAAEVAAAREAQLQELGELLRNKGSYRGEQLVPRAWVEEMVTPSPKSPHYGLQTWLNRPTGEDQHPLIPARAPESAFSMIGHMGQYVFVSPAQKLTVVRLGHSDAPERRAMLQQLADLIELYPAS